MRGAFGETVVWVLLERGLQVFVVLLLNGLLARHLGPDGFGVLQSLLNVANACAAVALMCSAEVLLPRYAASPSAYREIFQNAFYIRLLFSVVASAIYIFIIVNHYSDYAALALLLLPIVLLNEAFSSFAVYFQSVSRQRLLSSLRLSGLVLRLLMVVGLLLISAPLQYFGVSYALESVVVALLLGLLFRRAGNTAFVPVNKKLVVELVRAGSVVGAGLLAMVLMQKADRLYLAFFADSHQMGLYSAAAQIAENWFMLGTLITQAVSARYIYARDDIGANANIFRLVVALACAAIVVAAIGYFLAVHVVTIIYGAGFEEAGTLLMWLLLIGFFVFSDVALSTRMLKDRNSSMFVFKWMISLMIVVVAAGMMRSGFIKENAFVFPAIGYGAAFFISLIYYLRSRSNENSYCL